MIEKKRARSIGLRALISCILICPHCGDTMIEIGTEVASKLRIISTEVIVDQYAHFR